MDQVVTKKQKASSARVKSSFLAWMAFTFALLCVGLAVLWAATDLKLVRAENEIRFLRTQYTAIETIDSGEMLRAYDSLSDDQLLTVFTALVKQDYELDTSGFDSSLRPLQMKHLELMSLSQDQAKAGQDNSATEKLLAENRVKMKRVERWKIIAGEAWTAANPPISPGTPWQFD